MVAIYILARILDKEILGVLLFPAEEEISLRKMRITLMKIIEITLSVKIVSKNNRHVKRRSKGKMAVVITVATEMAMEATIVAPAAITIGVTEKDLNKAHHQNKEILVGTDSKIVSLILVKIAI